MPIDVPIQLGVGSRLAEGPSDLLVSAFARDLASMTSLYEGVSWADLAHVALLIEARLVPDPAAKVLLEALVEMHESGPTAPLDPRCGDVYENRDAELRDVDIEGASFILHLLQWDCPCLWA